MLTIKDILKYLGLSEDACISQRISINKQLLITGKALPIHD